MSRNLLNLLDVGSHTNDAIKGEQIVASPATEGSEFNGLVMCSIHLAHHSCLRRLIPAQELISEDL